MAFCAILRFRHCAERERRSNPVVVSPLLDCFAESVIGRAFARPVGCVPSMIDSLEVKVFYPA
jgi:hypothetical protein